MADTLEVSTTFLEMFQRPRRVRAAPHGERSLALLRAERPPLHFYRYLYETVGEHWLWYERRRLDDEGLSTIIHDERVEVCVLYVDGSPAGFVELDARAGPEIELAYLGLVPEFIGQGLGLYLIDCAVERAWDREPEPPRVWVHTCTLDHPRALLAYQHAGFQPYREAHGTIADPRTNGSMRPKR
ncbi:MAG: GNAT family N-acetyltransferase [Deltaproteobacteria bacterium]|nr:GNAT family N-acetyltransferase [Nannocystaceae bacterium]